MLIRFVISAGLIVSLNGGTYADSSNSPTASGSSSSNLIHKESETKPAPGRSTTIHKGVSGSGGTGIPGQAGSASPRSSMGAPASSGSSSKLSGTMPSKARAGTSGYLGNTGLSKSTSGTIARKPLIDQIWVERRSIRGSSSVDRSGNSANTSPSRW